MTSPPEKSVRGDTASAGGVHGEVRGDDVVRLDGVSADRFAQTVPGILFQRVRAPDGTLSYPYVSPSLATYVGYRADEVKVARDGCLDFIHWADRDTYLHRVRESARTGERCPEEFRAIGSDGEVRWLMGASVPEMDADGRVIWHGTLIDVTDRKRAEHWLAMIMDHAADVIVTLDEDGLIEQVNAASVGVFGRDPDDLIGKPVSVLMPQLEQGNLMGLLRRYLIQGERTLVGAGPREMLGRRADDRLFPIEVLLSEVLTEGRRLFIAVVRDVTERKAAEAALLESQRRLATIADTLQGLVFQFALKPDGSLRVLFVSGSVLKAIGQTADAVIQDAEALYGAMPADQRAVFMKAMARSARTLEPMEGDYSLIAQDGSRLWLRGSSRPRRGESGDVIWEGVALDVTERRQVERRVLYLAYHDPLTGLGNRSQLLERFRDLAPVSGGDAGCARRIALLSIRLDRLSIINATLGHTMGDLVVQTVARRLRETLPEGAMLFRAGGGRFLALVPDCGADADVSRLGDRLIGLFQHPVEANGHAHDLSVSVGASVGPDHGDDPETLIMHADAALHQAKQAGGGRPWLYTEDIGEQAARVLTMRHRMRVALERNEFRAYFQPQLDLASNRIVGTEALARWVPEDGPPVGPGEFIPIAEEYGLIDAICLRILEDACRWTQRWNALGLGPISVAVNISGRQFHDPERLIGTVDHALNTLGLEPAALELELTESTAMNDPENASTVIRMFHERGVGCCIDDFGTGYSSLSVLKRFALTKLKVDRSFVCDVTTDANDAAICGAIIAMGRALNLKVCAEGVETEDQLAFLRAQACDQVQGFLIARALPPDDLEALLRQGVTAGAVGERA
ncbi:EAL domain-containing protein [Roseospira marina]|uniref:EAL domain-containing protein n=1 Tax=Roseospira marina TaxID=140057 RepID=A0A5M6IBD2_9PROT|nr:EAL domain-containing protein [Roseospira marina]KAA5604928.1 EAL domain-containing protein [Roseospira marina]MBB4315272.1 diguanylate cyclase (GGDEF)-like protein/PAS domain S-box-containing protein [Roseospira marina]MBB5088272.1 diguanylate cyclase (GGDEF)-like protein/PAS domain S-box-containing protein [Roseospira marina]